jgi:hypothetical protein
VSEWINTDTISLFDSAICNKIDRSIYLRIIQIPTIATINWDQENQNSNSNKQKQFMEWVVYRGVSLSCAAFEPCDFMNSSFISKIIFSKITRLDVRNFTRKDFKTIKMILNSCLNLFDLRLHLNEIDMDLLCSELPHIFKQLNKINIVEAANCFTKQKLFLISSYCTDLVFLKLHCNNNIEITNEGLSKLFKNNNKLEHIDVDLFTNRFDQGIIQNISSFSLIKILAVHCFNLKYATFYDQYILDYSHVLQLLLNCEDIYHLSVGSDGNLLNDNLQYKILQHCKMIAVKKLHITQYISAVELFVKLANFYFIEFRECTSLTDIVISKIITKNSNTLHTIAIDNCGHNWTLIPIVNFIKLNPLKLQDLCLIGCHHLDKTDFAPLLDVQNVFECLKIVDCINLSTTTLLQLLDRSPEMITLQVSNCSNILHDVIHNYCAKRDIDCDIYYLSYAEM